MHWLVQLKEKWRCFCATQAQISQLHRVHGWLKYLIKIGIVCITLLKECRWKTLRVMPIVEAGAGYEHISGGVVSVFNFNPRIYIKTRFIRRSYKVPCTTGECTKKARFLIRKGSVWLTLCGECYYRYYRFDNSRLEAAHNQFVPRNRMRSIIREMREVRWRGLAIIFKAGVQPAEREPPILYLQPSR